MSKKSKEVTPSQNDFAQTICVRLEPHGDGEGFYMIADHLPEDLVATGMSEWIGTYKLVGVRRMRGVVTQELAPEPTVKLPRFRKDGRDLPLPMGAAVSPAEFKEIDDSLKRARRKKRKKGKRK